MVNLSAGSNQPENRTAALLSQLHNMGVTYKAVADTLGVNWRTVHRWSKGQTHPVPAGLTNDALTRFIEFRSAKLAAQTA